MNHPGPHGVDPPKADDNCQVCRDLLASLGRFFELLRTAPGAPDTEWLTVEEVAQELKISKSIVYRIIRSGELEAVDIVNTPGRVAGKGHYRIRRSSLNDYLQDKRVRPDSPTPQRPRPRRYPPVKNHLGL